MRPSDISPCSPPRTPWKPSRPPSEAFNRQLDQSNKRFEVGLIAITDVQEAKAARDQTAAAVIDAKRQLATAEEQLREVTGSEVRPRCPALPNDMPLKTPEPNVEQQWVDVSMDQNPQLLSSRLAADTARANVRATFGGHLPNIDLVRVHAAARKVVATPSSRT